MSTSTINPWWVMGRPLQIGLTINIMHSRLDKQLCSMLTKKELEKSNMRGSLSDSKKTHDDRKREDKSTSPA
jgi:hypothetical protein